MTREWICYIIRKIDKNNTNDNKLSPPPSSTSPPQPEAWPSDYKPRWCVLTVTDDKVTHLEAEKLMHLEPLSNCHRSVSRCSSRSYCLPKTQASLSFLFDNLHKVFRPNHRGMLYTCQRRSRVLVAESQGWSDSVLRKSLRIVGTEPKVNLCTVWYAFTALVLEYTCFLWQLVILEAKHTAVILSKKGLLWMPAALCDEKMQILNWFGEFC